MPIPTRQEIANHLYGVWLLARRDRGGVGWLDGSVDGFWKSFFAAVLIAPFFGLALWLAIYSTADEADLTAIFFIEAVSYVGAWFFWPLIASELCRLIDPDLDARTYIVACNWSEIWIMMLRLPLLALGVSGLLDTAVTQFLGLLFLIVVLFYRFTIARHTLDAPMPVAAGLTFVDMMSGRLWRSGTDLAVLPWLTAAAVQA